MVDFDRYNRNYDEILDESVRITGESSDYFAEYKVKVINAFFKKHETDKAGSMLDIGCGIGKIERFLSSYFPHMTIKAVDTSSESIKEAEKQTKNTMVSFNVFDGKKIPFPDMYFDSAMYANVLHHILPSERSVILNETKRVLKKGGFLFVFEHNLINPLVRNFVKECEFDNDASFIYRRQMISLLKNVDFNIVAAKYIVFFPHVFKYMRKFEKILGWCPFGAQYFIAAAK